MERELYEKLENELRALPYGRLCSSVDFYNLRGKTISSIEGAEVDNDIIKIVCTDGSIYFMYHEQDCCESVSIEDIAGDIQDLIGSPVILAEEVSNSSDDDDHEDAKSEYDDSWTWTYYKLATVNGYVTIRWYGASNGYYSESVDFIEVKSSKEAMIERLKDKKGET